MSEPLVLEWVAQPTDSQDIINIITSPSFLVIMNGITPLSTGAIRYYYIVQPLTSSHQDLQERIERIEYLPLTFAFNMVGVSLLQQRQYAQGLEEIIMAYLVSEYHIDVVEMEQIYLDDPSTLILKPMSRDGFPVYMSEEERSNILSEDYDSLVGYDLLSYDPLVWFYLDKEKIDPKTWYITSWHGMALFPIIPPPEQEPTSEVAKSQDIFIEPEDVEDMSTPLGIWWTDRDLFRREIKLFVSSLRLDRYFTMFFDEDILDLAIALGRLWKIEYYGTFAPPKGNKVVHVFASTTNLEINVASWFEDAIIKVRLGQLPTFYLGGDWVQYAEPTMDNMAHLQYAATRAYTQIAEANNPVLMDTIKEVRCLPNLLIAAPFSALDEVVAMENLFRAYLPETKNWQVIECSDLETSTQRRLIIQQDDPSLQPLGMIIPADPEVVYLVVDTPLGSETLSLREEGLTTQANGNVKRRREHQVKVPGEIKYSYIASYKETYLFSLDNIPLLRIATKEPVALMTKLNNHKEALLSSWGESYLKYYPETPLRREFFLPERILRKKYC